LIVGDVPMAHPTYISLSSDGVCGGALDGWSGWIVVTLIEDHTC